MPESAITHGYSRAPLLPGQTGRLGFPAFLILAIAVSGWCNGRSECAISKLDQLKISHLRSSLFFSSLYRSRGRLIHQMEGAWFSEWPGGDGPSFSKLHWPGMWTRNKVLLYQTTEIWGVTNYHHCFWQKQRGQQHIWGGECPADCQASSGGSAYRRELQMFPIESQGQSPTVGHALS